MTKIDLIEDSAEKTGLKQNILGIKKIKEFIKNHTSLLLAIPFLAIIGCSEPQNNKESKMADIKTPKGIATSNNIAKKNIHSPEIDVLKVRIPYDQALKKIGNNTIHKRVTDAKIMLSERMNELVKEGINLVPDKKEDVKKSKNKKTKIKKKDKRRDVVLLSVYNNIKNQSELIILVRSNGVFKDPSGRYTVVYGELKGVGTDFEITKPKECDVTGLAYPLIKASKNGPIYSEHAVNVPYSEVINDPEIINFGKSYLEKNISEAISEMKGKVIQSVRSKKGKTTEKDISKEFDSFIEQVGFQKAMTIILVEKMDYPKYYNYPTYPDKNGERLGTLKEDYKNIMEGQIRGVLACFGANSNTAYNYAVSNKKAHGIGQIIPSTYSALNRRYPGILIDDFKEGTSDHKNATKALLLHIFDEFDQLKTSGLSKDFTNDNLNALIIAGYNASLSTIIKKIKDNKNEYKWWENLPQETKTYLLKAGIVGSNLGLPISLSIEDLEKIAQNYTLKSKIKKPNTNSTLKINKQVKNKQKKKAEIKKGSKKNVQKKLKNVQKPKKTVPKNGKQGKKLNKKKK